MENEHELEGAWDCPNCGHKGIPGFSQDCPNCGATRSANVEFYLPTDAREITDAEGLKRAEAGPDWVCQYCSTDNSALRDTCSQCGAGRDGSAPTLPVGDIVPTEQIPDTPEEAEQVAQERQRMRDRFCRQPKQQAKASQAAQAVWVAGREPDSVRPSNPGGSLSVKPILAILLAAALIIGGFYGAYALFFQTHDVSAQVASFSWQRTIEQEAYGPQTHQGWSIPVGGTELGRSWQIEYYNHYTTYHSETVEEPYTTTSSQSYSCSRSNGNGSFSSGTCYRTVTQTHYRWVTKQVPEDHAVPVYDWYYTYSIYEWYVSGTAKANGSDKNPQWPQVVTDSTHRGGQRSESYTVVFHSSKRDYTYTLSQDKWTVLTQGETVILKVNMVNMVLSYKIKSA